MKLISWNVNGIRAVLRKEAWQPAVDLQADFLCLQETKAHPEQLSSELTDVPGYHVYFSSSIVKKGYSGVAVYAKNEPIKVNAGIGISQFDDEGRILELVYDTYVLLNVYFPNGGGGAVRLQYKMDFYDAFLEHIEKRRREGKSVIFCGDVNTAHQEIDLARPKENEQNTGFLPMEREWVDTVVAHGYVDTFRHVNPSVRDAYSWWDMKTRARERNVGWRIDYFFVSADLVPKINAATILPEVVGSDHCPVSLDIELS